MRRAGASVVRLVRAVVRWGVGQVRGEGTVGVAQRRCRRERHQAASGVGGLTFAMSVGELLESAS